MKGRLIAWDPVAQEPRWSVEHNNAWNGGILTTAGGLVFQGQLEGVFAAYDAATGELLWESDAKSGVASGPSTYEIDGVQYVTVTTGWGSAFGLAAGMAFDETVPPIVGKVITYKIGGDAVIPDPVGPMIERVPHAEEFGDEETLMAGNVAYARNCAVCHGPLAVSSGVLPDLRWSPISGDADSWDAVVGDGLLASRGMVGFSDVMSDKNIEAVRAYIVKQAHIGSEG